MSTCAKCGINKYGKRLISDLTVHYSFHRFPNDETRSEWIQFVGLPNWQPKELSVLCSRHFEDFCFYDPSVRSALRENAVPTIEAKLEPKDFEERNTKAGERQAPFIKFKPIKELIGKELKNTILTLHKADMESKKKAREEHPAKRVKIDGASEQLVEENEMMAQDELLAEQVEGIFPDIRLVKTEIEDSADIEHQTLEEGNDFTNVGFVKEEPLLDDASAEFPDADIMDDNDALAACRSNEAEDTKEGLAQLDTKSENPLVLYSSLSDMSTIRLNDRARQVQLKIKVHNLIEKLEVKTKYIAHLQQAIRRQNSRKIREMRTEMRQMQKASDLNLGLLRSENKKLREENEILKKRLRRSNV